jgi:hypothetical protein
MKRIQFLLSLVVLSSACGSKGPSPAAANLREASDSDLTDCAFLQKVQGAASDGDPKAEAHAKAKAREAAAAAGATHIKWIIPCCTSVEAEAYRCDVPD